MRFFGLFNRLIIACLLGSCCQRWQQPQPIRPDTVRGWNALKIGTLRGIGEFVLKEGESTESDTLGLQIVKISPLITCLGPLKEPPQKKVTIKLYNPSDKSIFCETTINEGSGLSPCPNRIELPFVSVNRINTRERWVLVSLDEAEAP